jgi:hypothetical protein
VAASGLKRAGRSIGHGLGWPVRRIKRRRAAEPGARGALGPPDAAIVDLQRRRDQLYARVAELQWDLGGLAYEMATRDRIQVDLLVRRAAVLQNADAELAEVERILRLDQTATAGECSSCGAPHSTGAAYCWQCGQPLLQELASDQIAAAADGKAGGAAADGAPSDQLGATSRDAGDRAAPPVVS